MVSHRFLVLACAVYCALVGCSRDQYRRQADQEVTSIVAEKSTDPRWGLSYFNIELDPRSRYFDPYPVDCTPMPTDDPVSHQFMHCVDDKKGWRHWHRFGSREFLENPLWRTALGEYVELSEDGAVKLNVDSALRLAYMHSPDHQRQLETLYLSALDVSTERFRLDTQFFGGNDTTYQHDGRLHPGGESNTLTTATDARLQRRFATAGELLVGFANSFVWQFAGPDTNATMSLLNLSLVQPLLRGAGRDIALEQLTIVERGLLANLRAYQRYRHGFYTNIAIGESGVSGPNRRGGFFGGTGLTGFTGQGSGGFGGVGGATGFGRGGFGAGGGGTGGGTGFAGGGAGSVGGFIGLLQTLQEIRNTQVSLESQVRTVSLLEANLEAGIIDLTQVDQFRQNIETERANLLQSRNALENSVENYLVGTLGLPPDVKVDLNDQLIKQFQFISQDTTEVQNNLVDLQAELGNLPGTNVSEIDAVLQRSNTSLEQVHGIARMVQGDVESLAAAIPRRIESMSDAEQELFGREMMSLEKTLESLDTRLHQKEPQLSAITSRVSQQSARESLDEIVIWLRDLISLTQEMSLVQARARVEAIVIEPVKVDAQQAFEMALTNRLDIMNNRASLVDTWRLIQFNADALQSDLDVVFNADLATVGNNPVKFRAPTGTMRVGLQFDAPFTRLLERNNYRQSLIDYQQDRRQLIQFYDGVQLGMRQLLRNMRQLEVNLEIQRRAVVIAIRRVDLTQEELNEPTAPPEPGQPASTLGPNAAINLLTALSDLRNTQNNFMSVWLNYYASRMRLHRETGVMQLDEQGQWIDFKITGDEVVEMGEEIALPPPVPQAWIQAAFTYDDDPTLPKTEMQRLLFNQPSEGTPGSHAPSASPPEPSFRLERPAPKRPTASKPTMIPVSTVKE